MINQDYFQLLGLPERYQIDLDALERSFRAVQSSVHPDRFVRAMDAERRLAMQMSTQANEAYRILSSPVLRAIYLCKRHGLTVEIDRSAGLSREFLEQQMFWHEQLDDADGNAAEIEVLKMALQAAQRERSEKMAQLIDANANYEAAAQLAREMLFIDKFRQSLTAAQVTNGS